MRDRRENHRRHFELGRGVSTEFDFIIVGAGSAGCVLARQLSERAAAKVLLIECGPDDHSNRTLIDMPKGFGKLLTDPRYAWHFATRFLNAKGAAPEIWARGKTLGGSSAVNGMVWTRGQPEDYDHLAALGNPGWAWADMLPYLRKLEDHGLGASEWRGAGGPIAVNTHPHPSRLGDALLVAGEQIGLRIKPDQNQAEHEGIGYLQANIDRRGRRVSAARGFLDPVRGHRSNLTIVTDTQVERVSFAGTRAVGVSCKRGGDSVAYRLAPGGEVILSAGAIQSPKLLQLSGIGSAEHLRAHGIEVLHDSPGVGQNLREHFLIFLQFRLKHAADSYNEEFGGFRLAKNVLKYLLFRSGPMAYASSEAAAFVKVLPGARRPEAQLMFSPYSLDLDDPAGMGFEKAPGMQLYPYALRPTSQGSVMIQSADPRVPPQIDPNYLATEYDRQVSIGMVHYVRKLMSQQALTPYVAGEAKWTREARSDDEILEAFKRHGQSGYHASGTCRMGKDGAAVVDERLRVRGVSGLRVMDCSVCPEIVAGNTNAPMMAMAWRASDLILEDRRRQSHAQRASVGIERGESHGLQEAGA